MTAQAVTGLRLRDLLPGESRSLGDLLDAAFSGYRDTTRFSGPVLAFLDRWAWARDPLSVGIEDSGGLVAVGLATMRPVRWEGRDLTAVHVGPIGVRPGHRRRGLGGRILEALEERAGALGADVLTLTTEVVYGAWRLYDRHGYQVLETYRPIVRPLFPGLPDSIGPVPDLEVKEVDFQVFAERYRPGPGRKRAVVETWAGEPDPGVLRLRYLCAPGAAVATLKWPVLSRSPDGRVQVWATQILRLQGSSRPMGAVLSEATRLARQDGSVCIYALPTVAEDLPGFSARGAPLVHRMVRPLTALGERLTRDARAWDEVCPAP